MEYTYLSPRPFNFREHDNPWILLCGDIEIYDLSSSDLTAAFLHFDPATWKDDALRYPGTVPEVHGSYDERSRTMTLEATGGELCGNQNFTARSCWIAASSSTPSTRRLLDGVANAGSSPLDRARTAAPSPRNDLVHPKHWLISTQAASCGGTTGRRRSRTSATRCGPCSTRPRRRCPSGTSVFGVVFVFDLWRGVDGATRREAHGVGTRRRSVAALAFERRRHRRDSPFALHRSRTCTSASSGYRSRTPRATGAPPSRSTSRSRRPRRS